MKKILIGLLLIVMCLSMSNVFAMTPPSFSGMIEDNITLNVPSDFTDIHAALNYLSNKRIATNATVTIQVADGTYNYTQAIQVKHPDGDRIQILGNVTSPQNCTINFTGCQVTGATGWTGSYALLVMNNNKLGYINGFKFVGDGVVYYGICAGNIAFIHCGANLIIDHFLYGISAQYNSYIVSTGTTVSNSTNIGYWATNNGVLIAQYSNSTNNTIGYKADKNSNLDMYNATFSGSGTHYVVGTNSVIDWAH